MSEPIRFGDRVRFHIGSLRCSVVVTAWVERASIGVFGWLILGVVFADGSQDSYALTKREAKRIEVLHGR